MIIYKNNGNYYIFIHIPKNGRQYMRTKILNDKNNEIIKSYWRTKNGFDFAHIPYMKRMNYINNNLNYQYYTYCRNPYHRIVSAFFFKNPNKNENDFKFFIKKILPGYTFSTDFKSDIIHYYPQYLFICDTSFQIPQNIQITKLEHDENYENNKDYSLYYDNECIEILKNIYIKDFSLFEYTTDFTSKKNKR
jgi:hypothetical protein